MTDGHKNAGAMLDALGRVGNFAYEGGRYLSPCYDCGCTFDGAKLARQCLPCAIAALEARPAPATEGEVERPSEPGEFVGDIFYGNPERTTEGTHRWTGSEWVRLPTDAEALTALLAKSREEAEPLRASLRDTLDFLERHSNRWDGVNGKHPQVVVTAARAALSAARPSREG